MAKEDSDEVVLKVNKDDFILKVQFIFMYIY